MYRSCIFCSAALGANEAIERFPVGRSLAFDAAKGRLWAVCPKCARWNLAPIHERWEAVEDAERLFHDTRVRAQRENIGLARLADGTRLIRVGEALPGEVAAWRYGKTLLRRHAANMWAGGGLMGLGLASMMGAMAAGLYPYLGLGLVAGAAGAWEGYLSRRVVQKVRLPLPSRGREVLAIRRNNLTGAKLVQPHEGELGIQFPLLSSTGQRRFPGRRHPRERAAPLTITGDPARALLARAMVHVGEGGDRYHVNAALKRIEAAGSAEAFLQHAAREGHALVPLHGGETFEPRRNLPLEIALHEGMERRALDGELAMLEAMWRDAEAIADIADRLPELPAPEPPRI
ncbi:MAG TPA: hypothetical protein VFR37_03865 [Longimicrobium sp.]|nr:hypothetical protein [Longimicrobium sp.]